MNMHADGRSFEAAAHPVRLDRAKTKRRVRAWRRPLSSLTLSRVLKGGRIADLGRIPRYAVMAFAGVAVLWGPIVTYLSLAPTKYTSQLSLILPGTGSQSSVNLSDIGQASSSANSPYASSAVSPTVTYKSILSSRVVADRAAEALGLPFGAIAKPKVKLLDQTSLIEVSMTAGSPQEAHDRLNAVLDALLAELESLRDDEIARRERASEATISQYKDAVDAIERKISDLRQSSGLISQQQYKDIVAANEILRAKIGTLRSTVGKLTGEIEALSDLLSIEPTRAAATLRIHTDAEFLALAGEVSENAARFAALSERFGAKHPKVVNARLNMDGVRGEMHARAAVLIGPAQSADIAALDTINNGERVVLLSRLVSLVADRDGAEAELAALRAEFATSEARVKSLVAVSSALDGLERDYQVAEAVFASALARTNTSKADVFASYPMVQIAEPATLPWAPSSPKLIIAIAAGVLGTMMLIGGLLLAWVRGPIIARLTSFAGDADA